MDSRVLSIIGSWLIGIANSWVHNEKTQCASTLDRPRVVSFWESKKQYE